MYVLGSLSTVVLMALTLFSLQTTTCSASVEDSASEYIVERLLPHHPKLAQKLLTVLSRSRPASLPHTDYLVQGSASDQPDSDMLLVKLLDGLKPKKRGLGHCINSCINGPGNMNFIQCKSMCH